MTTELEKAKDAYELAKAEAAFAAAKKKGKGRASAAAKKKIRAARRKWREKYPTAGTANPATVTADTDTDPS